MKEYRKKLKIQNVMLLLAVAALTAVQVLAYTGVIGSVAGDSRWTNYWNGFVAGVAMGLTILFAIGIVRNAMALRKEETLKKMFVKENDERIGQIYIKGKSAGASVGLCCMLVAGIICGYFNITVSVTCIVCTFLMSVCMASGKLYFSRKM